jgi:hypothetical protein
MGSSSAFENLGDNALFGVVSWKFRQKTQLSGEEFFAFVRRNPDADVYFVSPFTHERALWPSPWVQGEARHPGLVGLVERAFRDLGYDLMLLHDWVPLESAAFCNFFVANRAFWERYLVFVEPVVCWLTKAGVLVGADPSVHRGLFPFVVERLFTTFLVNEHRRQRPFRVVSFPIAHSWLGRIYGDFAPMVSAACEIRAILDGKPDGERENLLAAMRAPFYRHFDLFLKAASLQESVRHYQKWLAPFRSVASFVRKFT